MDAISANNMALVFQFLCPLSDLNVGTNPGIVSFIYFRKSSADIALKNSMGVINC
jgi:hypothetical protein